MCSFHDASVSEGVAILREQGVCGGRARSAAAYIAAFPRPSRVGRPGNAST